MEPFARGSSPFRVGGVPGRLPGGNGGGAAGPEARALQSVAAPPILARLSPAWAGPGPPASGRLAQGRLGRGYLGSCWGGSPEPALGAEGRRRALWSAPVNFRKHSNPRSIFVSLSEPNCWQLPRRRISTYVPENGGFSPRFTHYHPRRRCKWVHEAHWCRVYTVDQAGEVKGFFGVATSGRRGP